MMFLHWMMQSMASSMLVNDVYVILKAQFTLVCCNGHALSSTDYSHDEWVPAVRNRWSGAFRLLDVVLIGFSLEGDDSLILSKTRY